MIIQVVGLPCSGKSTAIQKIAKKFNINHIDSQNLPAFHTVQDVLYQLEDFKQIPTIIESACGYHLPASIIILLRVPPQRLSQNKEARAYRSSPEDEEQIYDSIVAADFTTYSVEDLHKLLATLIQE